MYLTCMTCCNNHFSSLSHHLPLKQPPLNSSPQVRCRVVCGSIEQSLAPLPSVPLKEPEFNMSKDKLKGDKEHTWRAVSCKQSSLRCATLQWAIKKSERPRSANSLSALAVSERVGQVVPSRDKPVSVKVRLPQNEGAVSGRADGD